VAPLISCPTGTTDLAITGSRHDRRIGRHVLDVVRQNGAALSAGTSGGQPAGSGFLPESSAFIGRHHADQFTMFHLVPTGSDITIENLRIVAPSDAPNTDAMDPGGDRIVIRKCEIDTGDDNVALHSGSHDVLIEDLTCLHGHGISIGQSHTERFEPRDCPPVYFRRNGQRAAHQVVPRQRRGSPRYLGIPISP